VEGRAMMSWVENGQTCPQKPVGDPGIEPNNKEGFWNPGKEGMK